MKLGQRISILSTIIFMVGAFCGCNDVYGWPRTEKSQRGHQSATDKGVKAKYKVDVCVYGATPGGIMAAYTAKQQGKKILLIEPSSRIGGMTAGGLGRTDLENTDVIGGLTLDFYKRIAKEYNKDGFMLAFEPKVALKVFHQYIDEAGIDLLYRYRMKDADKDGNKIKSITLESSTGDGHDITVTARVYIDCSYEGDLMARSGVSYTVGRESSSQYGETFNGVQVRSLHQFPDGVDPYKVKGDPTSGLLWGILPGTPGRKGTGDKCVQAYNFRLTLTNREDNKIPVTKPDNYDPSHYELLLRLFEVKPDRAFLHGVFLWADMPGGKCDANNQGAFSTDMIGANWDYPEASYEERERIFKEHVDYTKGLLYFLGNDPRVPERLRKEIRPWGYPKDEYQESGNFTPQLYVREARRMIGQVVMTQKHCQNKVVEDDYIARGEYQMDSHNCGRYVIDGMVKNEGDVQISLAEPYNISYRAITPKEEECANLLVPVCLSASHIAYGSIRMEPIFMEMGQAAGAAACIAMKRGNCVQKVTAEDIWKSPAMEGVYSAK